MKISKNILFLLPVLAVLILTTSLSAQIDGVDNNYAPIFTVTTAVGAGSESRQADGKLIVTGGFTIVNGVIRPKIVRLNADGSVDLTFNCTACTFGANSTLIQADGKILVGGTDTSPFGNNTPRLIRVNPDGSQDTSYVNGMSGTGQSLSMITLAPDGKAYAVSYQFGTFTDRRTIYRLNTDGTRDTSFTPFSMNQWQQEERFSGFTILPDGRMFIYGKTSYGFLAQMNSDGSKNPAFESPTVTVPPGPGPFANQPYILSFGMQSDNKPVFTGYFETVNALPKIYAARLNTDGGLDSTYTPSPAFTSPGNQVIKVFSGDKILFLRYDTAKRLVRHNPDGSVDNTYSAPDALTSVSRWLNLPGDQLLVWGTYNGTEQYVRLNADGSVDPGFTSPTFAREGVVRRVAIGPDGKSIVQGDFEKVNGVARKGLARLNADGTLDASFDPGTGFDSGTVYQLAVQSDGKVLAGGSFNGYNGFPQPNVVRINTNGSPDTGFVSGPEGSVFAVAVRPDGKVLLGGDFVNIGAVVKPRIVQLNSDGTIDHSFNAVVGSNTSHSVRTILVQADGKLMAGGFFVGAGGFSRDYLVRLNSDGSVDSSFNAGSIGTVEQVFQLSDGKYVTRGNGIKRLVSTGAADFTFTSPTVSAVNAIVPGTGGTILIGGAFTTVNGTAKNYLARILADGSLDILFNPNGSDKQVRAMAAQADGNVLVGGDFTKVGSVGRINLARLLTSAVANVTPFDFDGDGRADISVTRPGDFNWYQLTGVNYNFFALQFGQVGDKVTPADFDGDGKTDIGVFRPATGDWWYRSTIDGLQHGVHWGQNGDIPLSADYNGDGKSDLVAVRNYGWWIANAANGQMIMFINFGTAGDKLLVGDFDGDGKADPAVYRPSEGNWYYAASGSGYATLAIHWGIAEDIPVPADYDGDGKTDTAVFRPSEGNWYVLSSLNGTWIGLHFGLTGDKPIAADYDGDGKADIAVYRPSDHYWYILGTTAGFYGFPFGLETDIPSPNAFIQPEGSGGLVRTKGPAIPKRFLN